MHRSSPSCRSCSTTCSGARANAPGKVRRRLLSVDVPEGEELRAQIPHALRDQVEPR